YIGAKVSVERTEGNAGLVSVKVTNSSASTLGRATRKLDFLPVHPTTSTGSSQLLTWNDGEDGIKTLEFTIIQENLVEGDEFIPLSLGSYKGGAVAGAIPKCNLIIVDDDSAKGEKGEKGDKGEKGEQGIPGVSFAPPILTNVSGLELRQENLGDYGLNNRQHFYFQGATTLPNQQELPEGSNVETFLKEIVLPMNTSKFPVRQLRFTTAWAIPRNYLLFVGNNVESFIRPSVTAGKIIVCPTMALSGNANPVSTYTFLIGDGQRIWLATQNPNESFRLYYNVENYTPSWSTDSGVKFDYSNGLLNLLPV
ncbi:MAG: hypothetical protein ACRCU2_17380, partial [Planktothrix sp.]